MAKKDHLQANQSTEFLQSACREVWWTCSKLPSSKQVSAVDKRSMVEPTDGTVSGYSISKRIFTSKHPAVKRVNEVFRRIDALRDEYTIIKSAAANSDETRFTVEPGKRIIRIADIDEFEEKFKELREELQRAVLDAAAFIDNDGVWNGEQVESIKSMDKKSLGSSFNEKDYPTEAELQAAVRVTMPQYGTLKPDTLLPPEVLKRECARVNQELGDTVALAANRVAEMLIENMTTLAKNLSRKTLLDPVAGDEWREMLIKNYPVEVTNVIDTKQDRSVPKDSVKLELSWKQGSKEDAVTIKSVSPVMTKEDYQELLRPKEIGDKRALRTASIENFNHSLDCLSRVRSMLGEEGNVIDASLKSVKELLGSCSRGGNAADIAKVLKSNEPVSVMLQKALSEAVAVVTEEADKVIANRRKLFL